MRVAVTGASGFCGSALVRRLAASGHQVAGLDQYAPSEPLPVDVFIQGDLLDPDALDRLLHGADALVHMAALPAIARTSTASYERVNHQGTAQVLDSAARHGVLRVAFVSSSTVYGIPTQQPITEDTPLSPACDYSRSKAAAEARCKDAAQRHGMQVAMIRPRVVVGPGRAGVFGLLFAFLRRGWPVPLPGGARNLFQFTAVEDLADACAAALDSENTWTGARAFNVGAPVDGCLRDDLERLIRHAESASRLIPVPATPARLGLRALHVLGMGPMVPEQLQVLTRDFVLDTRRAAEELGVQIEGANGDGLLAAWDWWKENAPQQGLGRWWRFKHQNLVQERGEDDR